MLKDFESKKFEDYTKAPDKISNQFVADEFDVGKGALFGKKSA